MPVIQKINTIEEYNTAINGDGLVVMKYSGDWCGPCKVLSQTIERLSDDERNGVTFYEVDTDNDATLDLCVENGIRNLPTMLFYKQGKLVKRESGAVNSTKLKEYLNEVR